MEVDRQLRHRTEGGQHLPVVVWALPPGTTVASTAVAGGGLGTRSWVLNAQVAGGYDRLDPHRHVEELADELSLPPGVGAGLLTAADVGDACRATDGGVAAEATVGLHRPTWAAAPPGDADPPWRPGTVNVIVLVPAALSPAALVNLVATATEAKVQALVEAGVPGTGTASDAVVVACPGDGGDPDPFGGPRSRWGARAARAVHAAVAAGVPRSAARIEAAR